MAPAGVPMASGRAEQPRGNEPRNYLLSRRRRLARHVWAHGYRSLLGGITATGVLAGFLSASDVQWKLITYIAVAAVSAGMILLALGLRTRPRYGLPPWPDRRLGRDRPVAREVPGRPRQLEAVVTSSPSSGVAGRPAAPRRPVVRCDDP